MPAGQRGRRGRVGVNGRVLGQSKNKSPLETRFWLLFEQTNKKVEIDIGRLINGRAQFSSDRVKFSQTTLDFPLKDIASMPEKGKRLKSETNSLHNRPSKVPSKRRFYHDS